MLKILTDMFTKGHLEELVWLGNDKFVYRTHEKGKLIEYHINKIFYDKKKASIMFNTVEGKNFTEVNINADVLWNIFSDLFPNSKSEFVKNIESTNEYLKRTVSDLRFCYSEFYSEEKNKKISDIEKELRMIIEDNSNEMMKYILSSENDNQRP